MNDLHNILLYIQKYNKSLKISIEKEQTLFDNKSKPILVYTLKLSHPTLPDIEFYCVNGWFNVKTKQENPRTSVILRLHKDNEIILKPSGILFSGYRSDDDHYELSFRSKDNITFLQTVLKDKPLLLLSSPSVAKLSSSLVSFRFKLKDDKLIIFLNQPLLPLYHFDTKLDLGFFEGVYKQLDLNFIDKSLSYVVLKLKTCQDYKIAFVSLRSHSFLVKLDMEKNSNIFLSVPASGYVVNAFDLQQIYELKSVIKRIKDELKKDGVLKVYFISSNIIPDAVSEITYGPVHLTETKQKYMLLSELKPVPIQPFWKKWLIYFKAFFNTMEAGG